MNLTKKQQAELAIKEREAKEKAKRELDEKHNQILIKSSFDLDLALNAQRLNYGHTKQLTNPQRTELLELISKKKWVTFISKMKQYLV